MSSIGFPRRLPYSKYFIKRLFYGALVPVAFVNILVLAFHGNRLTKLAFFGNELTNFTDVSIPTQRKQQSNYTTPDSSNTNNVNYTTNFSVFNASIIKIFAYGFWKTFQPNISTIETGALKTCAYRNCYLTKDWRSSHVGVFNVWNLENKEHQKYCYNRSEGKLLVFYTRETPIRRPSDFWAQFNNCFHFSASYSRTADIFIPFGVIQPIETQPTNYVLGLAEYQKDRDVIWMSSHCRTSSRREKFIAEMQQYINVDVYGKCGNYSCAKENDDTCLEMLAENYYFFLSFENSLCNDYITEKVWRILNYNIVPVVLGGAKYSELLPANSFINVLDFASVKSLSTYLITLKYDPDAYNSYFHWRRDYRIVLPNHFCTICEFLNKLTVQNLSVISNLEQTWSHKDCTTPAW